MNVKTMTLEQIRLTGLTALARELGPVAFGQHEIVRLLLQGLDF